ncbi:MAG: hypothetical protein D3908_05855, partial [Candidatus Electrothrix sp. AUS4]|nr:hypothetical protein [Candidatus Electrothrix sp. AUS4]
KNGKKYKGEFKNDLPHGRGQLTSADGTVYEGMFKSGRRNGPAPYRSAQPSFFPDRQVPVGGASSGESPEFSFPGPQLG